MTSQQHLKFFTNPQSVALVGVSSRTGPGTFNVLEQMLRTGFKGRIYPVNPKGGSIMGLPVYRTVEEINDPVDLVIITTPRTAVPAVVKQCVAKGIKAIIIITQGFSDAGDEAGVLMHREILEAVRGTGTSIVGPNTLGVVNNFQSFNTAFLSFTTSTSPLGIICQSGIFLAASEDFCGGMGIGIDIGNTSDIGFAECLAYMGQDPRIKVINLHIEGLRDGRLFMETARQVTPHKPVLAVKTGSSEAGARAASSHSGSLAGEDAVFSAALAQSGIIRVENAALLAELNQTFITYREMRGKRIGCITISGGAGVMAVDACSKHGLEIAKLSPATEKALAGVFPVWMKVSNPADIWPAGMARGYRDVLSMVLEKMLSDHGVDAVLCISPAYLAPQRDDPLNIIDTVTDIARRYPHKPTAAWIFGPHKRQYAEQFRRREAVVAYDSPENAAFCLAQLYRYHNIIRDREYTPFHPPQGIDRAKAAFVLDAGRRAGLTALNEEALDILEAYGIPAAQRGLAGTAEEARRLAEEIGFPVVMKIASPDITHKSDAGGVKLNIYDGDMAAGAFREIMGNARQHVPGARIRGVLVQSQVPGGIEVILGGKKDPQFGPVLVYGLGGIFTEIIRDVAFRVAPVTHREAREMIEETKSYQVLAGARGREPGNIDALVDCLVRLGALLYDHPEIAEVDINPLLVQPNGCVALDARIIPAFSA